MGLVYDGVSSGRYRGHVEWGIDEPISWKRHVRIAGYRVLCRLLELWLRRAPSRPRSDDSVHFFVNDAFAMGGLLRTVFNLAGYLAARRPVTLTSVGRRNAAPFFEFPQGVGVHVVDDRFRRAPRRMSFLRRIPSVLTHPLD